MATAASTDSDFWDDAGDLGLDLLAKIVPVLVIDQFLDKPPEKITIISTPTPSTTAPPPPPPAPPAPAKEGMSTTTMVLIGVGALAVIGGGAFLLTR